MARDEHKLPLLTQTCVCVLVKGGAGLQYAV